MEIKRTTEFFVEKTRRFVIRQPETDETVSCPACGEQMLTAEAAAVLFQIGCRRIYQLVESGAAHFIENRSGATLVCPASLQAAIYSSESREAIPERHKQITGSAGEESDL